MSDIQLHNQFNPQSETLNLDHKNLQATNNREEQKNNILHIQKRKAQQNPTSYWTNDIM